MKKITLFIILIISFSNSETVFEKNKEEFQALIINSMIDGATGMLSETKNIITNPPKLNRQKHLKEKECNKKYWELQNQSSKYYWKTFYENNKIKKKLAEKKINYYTILKQRIKEPKINLIKLKKESCSKNYFDLALRRKKADQKIKNENEILKELAEVNNIKIKTKSLYEETKEIETPKKQKLNITIKSKEEINKEMLQAIQDVN